MSKDTWWVIDLVQVHLDDRNEMVAETATEIAAVYGHDNPKPDVTEALTAFAHAVARAETDIHNQLNSRLNVSPAPNDRK